MLVPLAVVLFAAFANAEPAINEARPHSNRPGRFLSLPIPQKCTNRKYHLRLTLQLLFMLYSLRAIITHCEGKNLALFLPISI